MALPLDEQIAMVIVTPPIMTLVYRIMAYGWAMFVQGGNVSETTRKRQKRESWMLLWGLYIMMIGFFVYGHFFCPKCG